MELVMAFKNTKYEKMTSDFRFRSCILNWLRKTHFHDNMGYGGMESLFSPPDTAGTVWCVAHDFSILDVSAKKMSYSILVLFNHIS